MKHSLIHLAERFYNRPHLITPAKARVLLDVFARRQGFSDVIVHDAQAVARDPSARAAVGSYVDGRGERRLFPVVAGDIAVIEASGTLVNKNGLDPYSGMTGYDGMSMKLNAAASDDTIRGIVHDIDSCGGEVSGLFDYLAEIRAVAREKPVWAVATDTAYSAAYAIAGSCDRFFLPETGGCGSIGVVMMHVDLSAHLEKEGIDVTLIHAGAHKVDGNPYETLPDDVFAELSAETEAVRQVFARTLEESGRMSAEAALATEARCYLGPDAVAAGLADGFMPAKAAIAEFVDFLDGRTAVSIPAAQAQSIGAAHLQPSPTAARAAAPKQGKEADMAKKTTRIPNAGRKPAAAVEDEEKPKDAPEAETDDDETDAEDEDEETTAATDDDETGAEDDDETMGEDDDEDGGKPAARRGKGGAKRASLDAATAQKIVALAEADAQPRLAQALAFAGVGVATAKVCLEAAAKDRTASQGGGLRAAMATAPAPQLGAGGGQGGGNPLQAAAKRMAETHTPTMSR